MGGQKRQDEEREGKPDQTGAVRAAIKVGKSFRVLKSKQKRHDASASILDLQRPGDPWFDLCTADTDRLENMADLSGL